MQDMLHDLYEIMPGLVSVRYMRRVGDVWADAVCIDNVERRPVSTKDGMLTTTDAVWFFWRAMLGDIVPKNGDKFEAQDGCGNWETWVVTETKTTAELLQNRYRVNAVKGR